MTKVRFHGPIAGFSGSMGEMVFKDYEAKGQTVAHMKKDRPPTEAQLLQQERFRLAAVHAEAALADPETFAYYEARGKKKHIPAYRVAVTDRLGKPKVLPLDLSEYMGRVGDPIRVIARDNVGVVEVSLSLVTAEGILIEKGSAVQEGRDSGHWLYTATVAVPPGSGIVVEAEASDRAENRTVVSASSLVRQAG